MTQQQAHLTAREQQDRDFSLDDCVNSDIRQALLINLRQPTQLDDIGQGLNINRSRFSCV
jgi:hypothetical protein